MTGIEGFDLRMPELEWIKNVATRAEVESILLKYPDYLEQPASVSGKYHVGDTMRDHVRQALYWAKEMVREFKIPEEDSDIIYAALILHDIGKVKGIQRGKVSGAGWKYFEATGWSGNWNKQRWHPKIGANIVLSSTLQRKEEIAEMVRAHMSHWIGQGVPETFYQRLVALADYLSAQEHCTIEFPEA